MKQLCIGTAVLGAALAAAPMLGYAQDVDIGKLEYVEECIVCHGVSGKEMADSPVSTESRRRTHKNQENTSGVFPFNEFTRLLTVGKQSRLDGPARYASMGKRIY